ncbi:MAG: hypothetical protein J7L82_00260 [Staphylothermus sp.]|nr:hypothetical protein [Staphylothermus sp.]
MVAIELHNKRSTARNPHNHYPIIDSELVLGQNSKVYYSILIPRYEELVTNTGAVIVLHDRFRVVAGRVLRAVDPRGVSGLREVRFGDVAVFGDDYMEFDVLLEDGSRSFRLSGTLLRFLVVY